jgi:hypothetical protein
MPTYYTFIPDSTTPTAEIAAPDARHARTVYLDYLSRNRQINYSVRGRVRKMIKINRMQPGEIQTSIQLSYGEDSVPTQTIQAAPVATAQPQAMYQQQGIQRPISVQPITSQVRVIPVPENVSTVQPVEVAPYAEEQSQQAPQQEVVPRLSPIGRASRGWRL